LAPPAVAPSGDDRRDAVDDTVVEARGLHKTYGAGVVALDRLDRLPLTGAQSWRAVVEHELGHVMGLGHPTSTTQLLSTVMPRTAAGYQAGDVAGLAKVGRAAGCITGTF